MCPLPSPEERRKRLRSLSLDEVLGRGRRGARVRPGVQRKPSTAQERERQRREAFRRGKSPSFG